jgi:hypothetical protein
LGGGTGEDDRCGGDNVLRLAEGVGEEDRVEVRVVLLIEVVGVKLGLLMGGGLLDLIG